MTGRLRAMFIGVPEHNYVLDYSLNVLTIWETFIVLGSTYQIKIVVPEAENERYPVAYCISEGKSEDT